MNTVQKTFAAFTMSSAVALVACAEVSLDDMSEAEQAIGSSAPCPPYMGGLTPEQTVCCENGVNVVVISSRFGGPGCPSVDGGAHASSDAGQNVACVCAATPVSAARRGFRALLDAAAATVDGGDAGEGADGGFACICDEDGGGEADDDGSVEPEDASTDGMSDGGSDDGGANTDGQVGDAGPDGSSAPDSGEADGGEADGGPADASSGEDASNDGAASDGSEGDSSAQGEDSGIGAGGGGSGDDAGDDGGTNPVGVYCTWDDDSNLSVGFTFLNDAGLIDYMTEDDGTADTADSCHAWLEANNDKVYAKDVADVEANYMPGAGVYYSYAIFTGHGPNDPPNSSFSPYRSLVSGPFGVQQTDVSLVEAYQSIYDGEYDTMAGAKDECGVYGDETGSYCTAVPTYNCSLTLGSVDPIDAVDDVTGAYKYCAEEDSDEGGL